MSPPPVEPRVQSVNLGPIREVVWRGRVVQTGIWKYPVGERAVHLAGVNLDGDHQADRTVHGGPDKAVYAYSTEDYRHWADHESITISPGLFGENLTTTGIDLSAAVVGERWRVGTALLEVTQPRFPCYKLGIRLGNPLFPRLFMKVGRHGAYFRIVEAGDIRAGDVIHLLRSGGKGVTLRELTEPPDEEAER